MISNQNCEVMISAQDLSDDFITSPVNLSQYAGCYIQFVAAGTTVTGTVKLQTSADYTLGGSDWDDVPDSSVTFAAAGSNSLNVSSQFAPWIRAVWTDSGSSASTMSIYLFRKD